jgi:hypothetical protein
MNSVVNDFGSVIEHMRNCCREIWLPHIHRDGLYGLHLSYESLQKFSRLITQASQKRDINLLMKSIASSTTSLRINLTSLTL